MVTGNDQQFSPDLFGALFHAWNPDAISASACAIRAPVFGRDSPAFIAYLQQHAPLVFLQADLCFQAPRMPLDVRQAFLHYPKRPKLDVSRQRPKPRETSRSTAIPVRSRNPATKCRT